MDRFVSAYSKATGRKQRIPAHWIGHPVFGARFELTPSARAAVAEEIDELPSESWTRDRLDEYATAIGLDTSGLPNKGEVLAAIEAALADAANQDPVDTPSPDETPATGDNQED